MADKPAPDAAPTAPQPSTPLERVRYVPEWEVPVNPPKRPLFSRAKLSRALRRSRLAAAIRPKTQPTRSPRSSFAPASSSSLHKDESLVGSGLLPTAHSTFSIHTSKTSTYRSARSRFDTIVPPHRKYLCGLTRATCILLFAILGIIIALALGLGLGLGLRNRNPGTSRLPLPDGSQTLYDGDLTFFVPHVGACGIMSTEAEPICAVGRELFDAAGPHASNGGNPNQNPLCGRWIRVTRVGDDPRRGNVTVDVKVVDRCEDCSPMDLDLSPSAFGMLAMPSRGRVRASWQWL
ncbi:RlpA-like double-psi beta-barrel-protein domain-containing protein-containing protein [Podospora aff. communis PSN243]|uniref:RlpA-like double-psi beta-barrel-protein domain-containing protein-containing protein n=1 Tax=Podospora aff. communis PSN243 TaxID=3040156 RepID=A0AAV9G9R6_9PEZI|nr:RlpA-like double-psi beta-barrel-protein domain-containing protein-containing protein [Podospora aff. communis PSN243]